jgi:hypothetical protein
MFLVQAFVQVGLQADSQAVRSLACKTVRQYVMYMQKHTFIYFSKKHTM